MAHKTWQLRNQIIANNLEMCRLERKLAESPNDVGRQKAINRLKLLQNVNGTYNREYLRRTGVSLHVAMPQQYLSGATPSVKAARVAARTLRRQTMALRNRLAEIRVGITNLKQVVKQAQQLARENPVGCILTWEGGRSAFDPTNPYMFGRLLRGNAILVPWDVEDGELQGAESELKKAVQVLGTTRNHSVAIFHMESAASLANAGLRKMQQFHAATPFAARAAIVYIRNARDAALLATGASGVAPKLVSSASEEGTQLLLKKYVDKQEIENKDIGKALSEIALAVGGEAAGKIASKLFAGPLAKRIFGSGASKFQVNVVGEILEKLVGSQYGEVAKALAALNTGKPVNWLYWTGMVVPELEKKTPVPAK